MEVAAFNGLPESAARELVSGCLGVPRWVDEVVDGRPYPDREALLARAGHAAARLSDSELEAALSRHPRIGERPTGEGAEAEHSRHEQAAVTSSVSLGDAERLRAGNLAYEERFGRVFLVRAAGRDSTEILAELDRRLGNDDEAERDETVTALREIALLRLRGLVAA